MQQKFLSHSASETQRLGHSLGTILPGPLVLTLQGPLGAGKTQFVKGLLSGLGSPGEATSPTFALCHYYPGRVPLLHVDTYRLKHPSELPDLGLDEALEEGYALAIEWPDGLAVYLPPVDLAVSIEPGAASAETRELSIASHSPLGERILQALGWRS